MIYQPKAKVQQVNVHLLKSSITDVNDAIAEGKSPKSVKAIRGVLPGGVLYYHAPPASRVPWRGFLQGGFGAELPSFVSQHASALLFFKAGPKKRPRLFAVTFGYGRALLSESALEPDFGLRAALNLCDPETLRAINFRTIEERTRIGRLQLSDAGSVDAFRMNIDTDLLRGLEAESKHKSVCERVGAKWSNLIVSARVEIGDLPSLATELLRYYRKRTPREYQWIDNVQRVIDSSLIESLNLELESRVNAGSFGGIRLAMPEIVGSTVGIEVKLFKASLNATDFTSDFATYLGLRERQVPWTVRSAGSTQRVYLVESGSGGEREHTTLFRCIVAEFDYKRVRYLLVDGEWFCLNREFVREVDEMIRSIQVLRHRFPAWNDCEDEGAWNIRACQAWKDAALLDTSNIPHGGGRGRVEPADIVTSKLVLCHAKRRDKSSSGLSHLFAQGVVSARLISQDPSFREKVRKRIPSSHKTIATALKKDFDSRRWTVGYVILGADAKRPAESLPFFSKVNLKGAVEQLRLMGYNVGIIGI